MADPQWGGESFSLSHMTNDQALEFAARFLRVTKAHLEAVVQPGHPAFMHLRTAGAALSVQGADPVFPIGATWAAVASRYGVDQANAKLRSELNG